MIPSLITRNELLWSKANILPSRLAEVDAVAKRLVAAKDRYQLITKATNVPWWVIAVIHERESGQDFSCQLAQGDPLDDVSVNDPKGRGPFFNHPTDPPGQDAFYRGALDALIDCPPHLSTWKDWSAGGSLTALLLYNGTGYEEFHNENSPYNWGATDQEQRGKYVEDGKFDPNKLDTQIGCAAMLKAMMVLDSSIVFTGIPD